MDKPVKQIYLYMLYSTDPDDYKNYSGMHHEALWYEYLEACKSIHITEI
jgi:hypothetical protein